ncbi:Glycoside hydrolase family 17 [Dillenia turbinata]|uniref:Glycoside hydrolase family 17 n=1 Tax=Dillenia turbinata TaxID=194707 RepID=A0AAN8W4K3_9MAGN
MAVDDFFNDCKVTATKAIDYNSKQKSSNGYSKIKHMVTDLGSRISNFMSDFDNSSIISLPFNTHPSCYSSPSSPSSEEALNPNLFEEEEILKKMKSCTIFEQKAAVILLRKLTKNREETRFGEVGSHGELGLVNYGGGLAVDLDPGELRGDAFWVNSRWVEVQGGLAKEARLKKLHSASPFLVIALFLQESNSNSNGLPQVISLGNILKFLKERGHPLLVNVHPSKCYIAKSNADGQFLNFALFKPSTYLIVDKTLVHSNLFDATLDSLHASVEKANKDAPSEPELVIFETGWPSEGSGAASSVAIARTFITKITEKLERGTLHVSVEKANKDAPFEPELVIFETGWPSEGSGAAFSVAIARTFITKITEKLEKDTPMSGVPISVHITSLDDEKLKNTNNEEDKNSVLSETDGKAK